jgi:hypothetical protein
MMDYMDAILGLQAAGWHSDVLSGFVYLHRDC